VSPLSREYFAGVADKWDQLRESYFSDSVREKAISISGAKAGQVAADIGAGTGFMSEGLLRLGVTVIAVDDSAEMLSVARRKLGSAVDFRLGSAEAIPIEDGKADCVFANMLLHHSGNPRAVIFEMCRILKEGGRVVITDLDEHNALFLRTEHHDRWMGFNRDKVRGWLEQAGMEEVNVTGMNESCCATSSAGENANVSIFAAVATKPTHKLIKEM
jgi:ubiquinone/menaquinone biosynthesis C-methylase UbiE